MGSSFFGKSWYVKKGYEWRDRSAEGTSRVTSDCSLTKFVAALDGLEDISDDSYEKAFEKFKDSDWREKF